jgi:hypothetical protein
MKKSQTTSKSSVKTAKLSAKKTAGTSLKAEKKTLKKPAKSTQAKTEKKKGAGAKASASLPKAIAKKVKPAPVSPAKAPAKAPAKKNVAGKTTKTVKKPGSKKPLKPAKKTPTRLSKPKAEAKPASAASAAKIKKPNAPEIRKKVTGKTPVKKPVKSSEKIAKTKKTQSKETAKTIVKSLTPGKKPAKKSPAKTVAPITKIAKKTTVKSVGTRKPSAVKVKKVVARKSEGKTLKSVKVTASAKVGANAKKNIAGKLKPSPEKKPLIAKTVPQIKLPAKQKTTSKPIRKEGPSLSPRRTTVKSKGTSSLAATEPLVEATPKSAATHIASSITPQAETKQKKSVQLKVFLPEEELPPEEAWTPPSPKLPEEFGENELLLMEVDPAIVFVSWEIKPDCISSKTGKLTLRVYDVTGVDFDGSNASKFFDITPSKRVDSKFIDIKMPGRDVIMEIGLLRPDGSFEPIKRSNRVSMPALRTLEELGINGSLSDSITLIGY